MTLETAENDSSSPDEFTPVFSYPKKLEICRVFIESKWKFSAVAPLKRIIDAGLVTPMQHPRDFRSDRLMAGYSNVYEKHYSESDAKNYSTGW